MKKSIALLIVAIVVCLFVYMDYARKPATSVRTSSAPAQSQQIQALESVAPDTVHRIEILPIGGQERIVLEKDADEWKVRSGDKLHAILEYKANNIFGEADDGTPEIKGPLTLGLQARNPENHAEFDLTDAKATRVAFFDAKGTKLDEILIGKSGNDWQSTYVRFPGKDEVYLVERRLTDNFSGADANAWRDKRMFPGIVAEDIYKIFVDDRANTRTFSLARRPNDADGTAQWRLLEPEDHLARASNADSMARVLSNLNTTDYIAPSDLPADAFEPPTLIARFDVKDRPTTPVLTVGVESELQKGRYYAKTNLSDEIYLIHKPHALSIDPETLKETPPPPMEAHPILMPPPGDETDETGAAMEGESDASDGSNESDEVEADTDANSETPELGSD